MKNSGRSKLNGQIYEEACAWFVECRGGDLDEAARREFDHWLRKSPEHLSAYLETAAIWHEGPALDSERKYGSDRLIAEAAAGADNIVPFSGAVSSEPEFRDPQGTPRFRGSIAQGSSSSRPRGGGMRRRHWAAIAASVASLAGALLWLAVFRVPTYVTAVGEQRSLVLADGSTITLNSRSKIEVRYSKRERNVELLEGQVLFHVSKDAARPFVVRSGATRVRAVGTQFDVYRKHDDTVVTVVEGRVAVFTPQAASVAPLSAVDPGGPGTIVASAGEQLRVTADEVRRSDHANVAGATAWIQRQLVFESMPLSEVAEEFNRYNEQRLVIVDPGLDTFHISGVFSSTDPASLLRFLRTRPGLRVVEKNSEIRIEKNSS